MEILIVKLSSIGDIIHTLPTLAAIHHNLPEAKISWVVEKRSAEMLRDNPLLKRLIEVDTKSVRRKGEIRSGLSAFGGQLRELRATDFDVALDFQGLLKSAAIAKLARTASRYGFAREALREPASRFLLNKKFEIDLKSHVIVKNLALARQALNIPTPEKDFEFPIFTRPEHVSEAEKIISQTGANFAILNPAGGWATKLWQAEKFGELADRLWEENGLTSVVAVAPNEMPLAERVLKANKSGKIVSAAPSLKGFYELAKLAGVYVGGDTGPTHLAVAAKAPVVGLFGPTEWWYNGSPNPLDICVERRDIDCRADCHRRTCDRWICMEIEVETVFEAIQKRLARSL